MSPRAPLKVGFSPLTKAFLVVVAVAIAGVSGFVALVAYGFAYGERESVNSSIGDGIWHRDADGKLVPGPGAQQEIDTVGWVGMIVGGLCSLSILLVALYLVLRALRTAAWLSGTKLVVRGAARKRAVELSTARVTTKKKPNVLVANDISLPLKGLPDTQLMMLANAISNKRVRSGDTDEAFVTADRLRELARDPFA